MRARTVLAAVAALLAATLTACGGDDGDAEAPAGQSSVTVFAAASLTSAFGELAEELAEGQQRLDVHLQLAGSQALLRQLRDGARADVLATADEDTMRAAVEEGLVEEPRTFATNSLEIVVEPGNPKGVRELEDLARGDLVVVLADPSVPAGRYAADVLRRAGVTVQPSSLELDVKAVLAKVTAGEADAGIVYRTDIVAAGADAAGVSIATGANVVARYPIAVASDARDPTAARAFVDAVLGEPGRRALRAAGFGMP